jgi:tetratricopeptide (TPR) repeat protein
MGKPPVELHAALKPRFEVKRELGRGGMGIVLLAHDTRLERDVALKVLTPEVSSVFGPERFEREIRLTARLVHPNLVPLFDSGQVGNSLYYVMPYIDGETLPQRLDRNRTLPPKEVIRITSDLAEALAYAHAMGAVHRDLKPENTFEYRGRALLADFGVALSLGEGSNGRITETGSVIGSPMYLSPEQAEGEVGKLDGRSDLYSLGCVMFELLTGRVPFEGPNSMSIIVAHVASPVPRVRSFRPEIQDDLDELVHDLMAKKRDERPAHAGAVLDRLRSLDEARPSVPTRVVVAPGLSPAPPLRSAGAAWIGALDAFESFRQGADIYHMSMQGGPGTRHKLELAKIYLEKARAKVPENAQVLTLLSDVTHVLGIRGFTDLAVAEEEARKLRLRALELDETCGEVHTSIGVSLLYWDDEFELGGAELRRGAELAPDAAQSRRLYGAWLKIAGRLDEALDEMRAAVEAAPKAPFMWVGLGDVLMTMGRYDEALRPLREALRHAPGYDAARERLEMSCHRAGRHDEALAARRAMLGTRNQTARLAALDELVQRDGWIAARERDLRTEVAGLLAQSEGEDAFSDRTGSRQLSDRIIITLADLGEWHQAMDWVERAYHRRPGRLRRILTDLPYDHHGLAIDPRYARLLQAAGLADLLTP